MQAHIKATGSCFYALQQKIGAWMTDHRQTDLMCPLACGAGASSRHAICNHLMFCEQMKAMQRHYHSSISVCPAPTAITYTLMSSKAFAPHQPCAICACQSTKPSLSQGQILMPAVASPPPMVASAFQSSAVSFPTYQPQTVNPVNLNLWRPMAGITTSVPQYVGAPRQVGASKCCSL